LAIDLTIVLEDSPAEVADYFLPYLSIWFESLVPYLVGIYYRRTPLGKECGNGAFAAANTSS
jgi:hypothetical protein